MKKMSYSSKVEIISIEDGGVVTWAKSAPCVKIGLTKMNVGQMAVALDNAITAMDNRAIVDILTKISNSQRMEIVEAYTMKFGKDITFASTKNQLKLNFEKVLRSLIVPLPTFLARELHEAITSVLVDRDAILEILCGSSNNLIKSTTSQYELMYERPGSNRWISLLQNEYNNSDEVGSIRAYSSGSTSELVYGRSLEMDFLEMDAQEDFQDFCIALALVRRSPETAKINAELVKADALALYNAGGGRYWWSDDENESRASVELAVWRAVLTQRSHKHLLRVFSAYNDLAKTPIEEAIMKQFTGDIRKGFSTMVKCITNKAKFFAERLHYSMEGFGTSEKTLTRVVVSNADVGFRDIKRAFKKNFRGTLEEWITDDTSGDYRNILLSIVNPTKDHAKESDKSKQKSSQ